MNFPNSNFVIHHGRKLNFSHKCNQFIECIEDRREERYCELICLCLIPDRIIGGRLNLIYKLINTACIRTSGKLG